MIFGKDQFFKIGAFQLENILTNSPSGFLLLDLRKDGTDFPNDQIQNLLKGARSTPVEKAVDYVQAEALDKGQPIILFCENGKASRKVAKKLEKLKYTNICVVTSGMKELEAFFQG